MKLTNDQIKVIAKELNRSKTTPDLAKLFNVSSQVIANAALKLRTYGVNIPKAGVIRWKQLAEEIKQGE